MLNILAQVLYFPWFLLCCGRLGCLILVSAQKIIHSMSAGGHKAELNCFNICVESTVIAAVERILLDMHTEFYQLSNNQLKLKINCYGIKPGQQSLHQTPPFASLSESSSIICGYSGLHCLLASCLYIHSNKTKLCLAKRKSNWALVHCCYQTKDNQTESVLASGSCT
jgi:hypothetical protein